MGAAACRSALCSPACVPTAGPVLHPGCSTECKLGFSLSNGACPPVGAHQPIWSAAPLLCCTPSSARVPAWRSMPLSQHNVAVLPTMHTRTPCHPTRRRHQPLRHQPLQCTGAQSREACSNYEAGGTCNCKACNVGESGGCVHMSTPAHEALPCIQCAMDAVTSCLVHRDLA